MIIRNFGVLAGILALFATTSASASITDQGRYEWRPGVQAPGPRTPLAAPRRIWVSSMTPAASASACPGKMAVSGSAEGMRCCERHSS